MTHATKDRTPAIRTKPDFIIAGHSKCGTTALHELLDQHPQLFMTDPKEPNFFAADLCRPDGKAAFRSMDDEEYMSLFNDAAPNQLCGESSASNIISSCAAKNAADWNPLAKQIVIFREPVDFLVSYHQQLLKNPIADGETERDLMRALDLEPQRKRGAGLPRGQQVPELLYYSERLQYRNQLERLYEHFPPEQVEVIIYDDFRSDNREVLQRVCRFLGVDDSFQFMPLERNPTKRLRSKVTLDLLMHVAHGRGLFAPVKRALRPALGSSGRTTLEWALGALAFRPNVEFSAESRRRLMKRFCREVEGLGGLIGRDLVSEWGYQHL